MYRSRSSWCPPRRSALPLIWVGCPRRRRAWLSHRPIGWFPVVRTVRRQGSNRAWDLVEQRADQGSVTVLGGRSFRGEDLTTVGIDRQLQLAPGPARLSAVLLELPFTDPEHSEAGAFDHHVNRPGGLLQGGRDAQVGAAAGDLVQPLAGIGRPCLGAEPQRRLQLIYETPHA
jgi:hypothetical protein